MCGFIGKISDKIDNFEIYKESNEVISCRGQMKQNTYFRKLIKFFPTARIIKTYWLFSIDFRLLI